MFVFRLDIVFGFRRRKRNGFQGFIQQGMNSVSMRRGNDERIAQTELIKVRDDRGIFHTLCLVDSQNHGTPGFAQIVCNRLVVRCNALTAIDDKDNNIRLGNSLLRLFCHLLHDAFFHDRLKPARIDNQKRAIPHSAFTIVAVAGQAGKIGDQRSSRARQAIE